MLPWSLARQTIVMRHRAALACRSPSRLRRCRFVLPLLACTGLWPQREANGLFAGEALGVVTDSEQQRGDVGSEAFERDQTGGGVFGDAAQTKPDLTELLLQEQGPLSQLAKGEPSDGGQAVVISGDPEAGAGREKVTLGQVP